MITGVSTSEQLLTNHVGIGSSTQEALFDDIIMPLNIIFCKVRETLQSSMRRLNLNFRLIDIDFVNVLLNKLNFLDEERTKIISQAPRGVMRW